MRRIGLSSSALAKKRALSIPQVEMAPSPDPPAVHSPPPEPNHAEEVAEAAAPPAKQTKFSPEELVETLTDAEEPPAEASTAPAAAAWMDVESRSVVFQPSPARLVAERVADFERRHAADAPNLPRIPAAWLPLLAQ